MKNSFPQYLLGCLLVSSALTAQPVTQKLKIEQATVFLSGAELKSTAKITLNKGENEFLFTNVAGNVNTESVSVNAAGGVAVESVVFQNNFTARDNVPPNVTMLQDSIAFVTAASKRVKNRIASLKEQVAILEANRKASGENAKYSAVEIQKMMDLVAAKMEGILNRKSLQEDTLATIARHLQDLGAQLAEEQKTGFQHAGRLLVKFYSKAPMTTNVTISYVVSGAGWSPTYDVITTEKGDSIILYYKANVFQSTGVKWDNLHLVLSTGNPVESMEAPHLDPWNLFILRNIVKDEKGDVNGVDPGIVPAAAFASPAIEEDSVAETNTAQILYSWSSAKSMNDYVKTDNAGVNARFDIELPYTIPGDGQQHLVAIKQFGMPASYQYTGAPKIDEDAFLVAKIANWEDLNLLPGKTNIFDEGAYVGHGEIDTKNVKDTLELSLGRDKKIIVKRERDKKLRSKKMIGTNVREAFNYNITVRNTRKDAITIAVNDQIPVSNDGAITIENKETGGAIYDEVNGSLLWVLKLKPNEVKTLSFGFTVKYPKGVTVENLAD